MRTAVRFEGTALAIAVAERALRLAAAPELIRDYEAVEKSRARGLETECRPSATAEFLLQQARDVRKDEIRRGRPDEDEVDVAWRKCRSSMPVRVRIHSSEVSTILSRSKLVSTFSGRYFPVPIMREYILAADSV